MYSVLIPLASHIHSRDFISSILDSIPQLENIKILDIAFSDNIDLNDFDVVCLLIVTGGVSRIAYNIIKRGGDRKFIILSHGMHNSLPSSLSLVNRLKIDGKYNYIHIHSIDLNQLLNVLKLIDDTLSVVNCLKVLKIIVIAKDIDAWRSYQKIFGGEIIHADLKKFRKYYEDASGECNIIFDIDKSIDNKSVQSICKLYNAFKLLMEQFEAEVIAVDCFDLIEEYKVTPCYPLSLLNGIDNKIAICEADPTVLPIMLLSKKIFGDPGWIGNISNIGNHWIKLVHCTISPSFGKNLTLTSHFETGLPAAVRGDIHFGVYSLSALSKDLGKVATYRVKVIGGSRSEHECRTQVYLKLMRNKVEFEPINNHHVLTPSMGEALRLLSFLLGLEYLG